MNDEFIIIFLSAILMTVIMATVCVMIGIKLDKISCNKIAVELGYQCNYDIWTGCIIKLPNGKKILLEQIRNTNELN